MQEQIQQIEKACITFQTTSQSQERKQAEVIIQQLLNGQQQPYALCRAILEQSTNPYTCFQASNTFRKAIIREWNLLNKEFLIQTCEFILQYCSKIITMSNLAATMNQLISCFSFIQRRAWIMDEQFRLITTQIIQQLFSSEQKQQQNQSSPQILFALQLLYSLIQEFSTQHFYSSSNSKSDTNEQLGIPLEQVEQSRKLFETHFLQLIFQTSISLLQQPQYFKHAINLLKEVLHWDFSPIQPYKKLIHKNRLGELATKLEPLHLPIWKQLLTRIDTVQLLFSLLQFYQQDATNSHLIHTCLTQYCSVSPKCFSNNEESLHFFSFLFDHLLQFCSKQSNNALFVYDTCNALHRLFHTWSFSTCLQLPNLLQMLQQFHSFTMNSIPHLFSNNEEDSNHCLYMDSVDICIQIWITMTHNSIFFSNEELPRNIQELKWIIQHQYCYTLFEHFVTLFLASLQHSTQKEEEYDEMDEMSEQLQWDEIIANICQLARESPPSSFTLLSKHLLQLIPLLKMKNTIIWESLDWILQFVRDFLCDHVQSETPSIPFAIQNYITPYDQLLQMLYQILIQKENLSPKIMETLFDLVYKWTNIYYKLNTTTTNTTNNIITVVYELMIYCGTHLQQEMTVNHKAMQWFKCYLNQLSMEQKQSFLQQQWNTLYSLYQHNTSMMQSKIMECICYALSSLSQQQQQQQQLELFLQLWNPLQQQWNTSIPSKMKNTNSIQHCVIVFMGMIQSTVSGNVNVLFQALSVHVLPVIHSVIQYMVTIGEDQIVLDCFKLLNEMIEKMNMYLNSVQCNQLYNTALQSIQVYSQWNQKHKKLKKEEQEEESNIIVVVLELLSNITSKEYLDFSEESTNVNIPQIVLQGLHFVLPLLSMDLLQFPTVCKQYFILMNFVVEIYPDKIAQLPHQLFEQIILSIKYGMEHVDSMIARKSLEAMRSIAEYHIKSNKVAFATQLQQNSTLLPFCIKSILQLCLYEAFDREFIELVSNCLFAFVQWDQQVFQSVIQSIIQQENGIEVQQKLAQEFSKLFTNIQFVNNPKMMNQFSSNMEEFLPVARALVQKK